MEAAYLHVLTDLLQSIGVAIAGLAIWLYPKAEICDPLCTVVFSFFVMWTTFPLTHRIFTILMEGKPDNIDWKALEQKLKSIPGVVDVHDLHVWSLTSQRVAVTAHITARNPQAVLRQAHKICGDLGLDHATIQVNDADDKAPCPSLNCIFDNENRKLVSGCMN